MIKWTQDELDSLIACEKETIAVREFGHSKEKRSFRGELRVRSLDGESQFRVFLRQHQDEKMNFSVGLQLLPPDSKDLILFRCNGVHAVHKNQVREQVIVTGCHYHFATVEALAAKKPADHWATPTTDYSSFEQAVRVFAAKTRLTDAAKHLSFMNQLGLFEEGQP